MKVKIILLFAVIAVSISCERESLEPKCCSCLEAEGKSDKYIYPVQPGSEGWKRLNSHQEMVNVCQVPDEILKNMCTSGLIDTYLDYPLLFTIFAFNNTNDGLRQVATEFNGFLELLRRNDCATRFLQKYKVIDPAHIRSLSDDIEVGVFMQKIRFFELTLAFEPLRNKLTGTECKTIIEIGLKNLEKKEANNYGNFSLTTNIYLLTKILESEQYPLFLEYQVQHPDINLFLMGHLIYFDYKRESFLIKNICQEYLKR